MTPRLPFLFDIKLSGRAERHFLWEFPDQTCAGDLKRDLPHLDRFVTLSPVPVLEHG